MRLRKIAALAGALFLTFGLVPSAFAGGSGGSGGDKDCGSHGDYSVSTSNNNNDNNQGGDSEKCDPAIKIVKTADPETLPAGGGDVTYTYVVTNTGDVPLIDVAVSDDKCAPVTGGATTLDPGDSTTFTCAMTLTETTTNVGTATADWVKCSDEHDDSNNQDNKVQTSTHSNNGDNNDENEDTCTTEKVDPATDDATVTVAPPADLARIYLHKTASVTDLPAGGGEVTYTYAVWNIGNVPLTDVTLVDNKCSPISAPTGDANDDSILDLTETWTYTCTMTLTATTTNLATATGHHGEDTTIDAAEVTVTVGTGDGGVDAATDTPTAPPTDSLASTTTDAGGSIPILLLILGVIGVGAVVLTPRRARR